MRIAYNPMSLVSVCILKSNGGRTTETRHAGKGLLPLFILIITCPRYWPIELIGSYIYNYNKTGADEPAQKQDTQANKRSPLLIESKFLTKLT